MQIMDPLTLRQLAIRASELSAADRELECLIGVATDWCHPSAGAGSAKLWQLMGSEEFVYQSESPQNILSQLPRYTRSIDAIMSLMPAGWDALEVYRPVDEAVVWSVYYRTPDGVQHEGFGETYEYALLRAALYGIAAEQEKG